ncbi:hypothetical protein BRARA_B02666 [Brassica rapa]|uniref:Protein kinase domain-containing protein n=1 Tax=Brassica campestris TaxID=3711 RepID=A0A398ACU0_BRACM|nr:hypothetical protein BRARA_B02666 [Brassica rapa]
MLLAACGFTDETDRQVSSFRRQKRCLQHKRVIGLELGGLQLGGVISPSIGNLSFLISLDLSNNSFGGTIPQEVGKLFRLEYLYMSSNVLRRGMPTSLSNCSRLLDLHLYTNPLGGGVPSELGSLKKLVVLDIGNLTSLIQLSLGECFCFRVQKLETEPERISLMNQATHIKPKLKKSIQISFRANALLQWYPNFPSAVVLSRSVDKQFMVQCLLRITNYPDLGKCLLMENLYLRENFFYREIPDIRGLVGLKRVDLSNNISGSILGYFSSFPLLEYLNQSNNNFEGRVPTKAKFQNSSLVSVSGNNNLCGGIKDLKLKPCFEIAPPMDTSKVVIGVSTTIFFLLLLVITSLFLCWFIKINMNLQTDNPTPSALETFYGKITCSSIDYQENEFRALIYEFMPHGSVDMWLHQKEVEDIAHCDLKPNKVLLDDDFIAHVSDFGLARLLLKFDEEYILNQLTSAGVRGTIGYTAPATPSQRCQTQLLDIVDKSMLHSSLKDVFPLVECLTLILEVGLRCCEGSPTNRLAMSQAEKELISVRESFYKSIKCYTRRYGWCRYSCTEKHL